MIAQALLEQPWDAEQFQRALARRFRWWLASLPAGVGLATLRAILKLWCGCASNAQWGRFRRKRRRDAQCGARRVFCKRRQEAAGVCSCEQRNHTSRSTCIIAALAVAEAAAWMSRQDDEIEALLETLDALSADSEWQSLTPPFGWRFLSMSRSQTLRVGSVRMTASQATRIAVCRCDLRCHSAHARFPGSSFRSHRMRR
jgi:hypothetical protein